MRVAAAEEASLPRARLCGSVHVHMHVGFQLRAMMIEMRSKTYSGVSFLIKRGRGPIRSSSLQAGERVLIEPDLDF